MLYQAAVYIHLLAAMTWIGGMLFLAMVMVPLIRSSGEQGAPTRRLLGQAGRRFVPVAWGAIALLVATGIFIAWDHWHVGPDDLFSGQGRFIEVLRAKVGLVAAAIALSFMHDFVLGPRLAERLQRPGAPADDRELRAERRRLAWLARANVLLVLAIVALGVTLTRGSPF